MNIERLLKYGFVIPTREYNGGVLGGFGFGMIVMAAILSPEHRAAGGIFFLSLTCIVAGSLLARAAQRKRFLKACNDEKPVA